MGKVTVEVAIPGGGEVEQEAAGHTVSVRKQSKTSDSPIGSLPCLGHQPISGCCPHSGWVFRSGNILTDVP